MIRSVAFAAVLALGSAAALAQNAPVWQRSTPAAPGAPAAPAASANTGKVLEAQNAGGYTYLHVQSGSQDVWIAVPEAKIPVGATVQWAPGAVMQNFHSKTLNRTFPQIVFSGGAQMVK